MKIDNRTAWSTPDLRRLFARVLELNRKHEGPFPSKRLRVKVVNSRRHWRVSGHAWFHSGRIVMRLPKPEHGALNTVLTAAVFDHELQHCRGHDHGVGLSPTVSEAGLEQNEWAAAFPVLPAAPKPPKPKPDRAERIAAKLDHAHAALKRHEKKRKLAETLCKRWKRRIKRYETMIERLDNPTS